MGKLLALFDDDKHHELIDNFAHNKIKREHEISQVRKQMFTNKPHNILKHFCWPREKPDDLSAFWGVGKSLFLNGFIRWSCLA